MERTTSNGLLLRWPRLRLTQTHHHPRPHPQPLSPRHWTHLFNCPNLSSSRSPSFRAATRWDPDAESSSGDKRRWWSDEDPPDFDDAVQPVAFTLNPDLEDLIDSLWILKVFKSFGWLLPFILASFLLATGPDVFLMAFEVSLGLSALVLAFEKLFGSQEIKPERKAETSNKPFSSRTESGKEMEEEEELLESWLILVLKGFGLWAASALVFFLLGTGLETTFVALAIGFYMLVLALLFELFSGRLGRKLKRKAKTRKKPFSSRTTSNQEMEEELQEGWEAKKGTPDYQSWAAAKEDSKKKGEKDVSGFGGWDDLDKSGDGRQPEGVSGSRPRDSRKRPRKRARRSRKESQIAIFPFLNSWTRMF